MVPPERGTVTEAEMGYERTMVWRSLLGLDEDRWQIEELRALRASLGLEGRFNTHEGAIGWLNHVEVSVRLTSDRWFGAKAIEISGPSSERDSGIEVGPSQGERDSFVGDPVFDEVVALKARPEVALSAADPPTRQLLVRLVKAGISWNGRRFCAAMAASSRPTAEEMASVARLIASAHAPWLSARSRDPKRGVLDRIVDPAPGVRRRAIRAAAEHGWIGEADLGAALSDYDPGVKLAAAHALGAWDVLLEIVRSGSRTWRVRAAVALARRSPSPPVQKELEAVLIRALPDPELAESAALALADVGSPAALQPLMNETPPAARAAAHAAADRIRSRAAPLGSLAIVTGEQGALSVAEDTGGRLSQRR